MFSMTEIKSSEGGFQGRRGAMERGRINVSRESERSRRVFQVRAIRWSYRIRGRVAREIRKSKATRVVRRGRGSSCIKRVAVRRLMRRMLVYSAIKIIANPPPLYSVLKPETSSDSPSAKSKGARLVSAKMVINQAAARGGKSRIEGSGLYEKT